MAGAALIIDHFYYSDCSGISYEAVFLSTKAVLSLSQPKLIRKKYSSLNTNRKNFPISPPFLHTPSGSFPSKAAPLWHFSLPLSLHKTHNLLSTTTTLPNRDLLNTKIPIHFSLIALPISSPSVVKILTPFIHGEISLSLIIEARDLWDAKKS